MRLASLRFWQRDSAPAQRPVWLFSLDTEQFCQPPMTTGALKAYFTRHGATGSRTDVELVHFTLRPQIDEWLATRWLTGERDRARAAVASGQAPVAGFSCYTWNTTEFLELGRRLREDCPGMLLVGGGPQVQRAEDFLVEGVLDAVVIGEGEITFTEMLDAAERGAWRQVPGLAFRDGGAVVRTLPRPRVTELDRLPSALEVIELRDQQGRPRYRHCAYETTRGCPFRCAFCEWGTGAIGTKMHQFSLERIRRDWTLLIAGGVEDLWLSDSNFGALPEDLEKAQLVVELRQTTGSPRTFQTSWSKSHSSRVQEIVLLLHRAGLLQHYNLALQTLTPQALDLSRRRNMRSNRYEPIAKSMTEHGVQIATELIWGLPGDNLDDFARNLDKLAAVFPNINIFGYTLLPGTEFYQRREEYRIETILVAGYGASKGDYVVACHTFDREQGYEGYFLITAFILLVRGYIMPLTARYFALAGVASISDLLRAVLRALLASLRGAGLGIDLANRMAVYEARDRIYLALLHRARETFEVIDATVATWLGATHGQQEAVERARQVLSIDSLLCPRVGPASVDERDFEFASDEVERALGRMELPPAQAFAPHQRRLRAAHPGGVGEVLKDPDGGSWMRGLISAAMSEAIAPRAHDAPA